MSEKSKPQKVLDALGYAQLRGFVKQNSTDSLNQVLSQWFDDQCIDESLENIEHQVLHRVPGLKLEILTANFKHYIKSNFGENLKLVGSTFYNKTPTSQWAVGYHQDLKFQFNNKIDLAGFDEWHLEENSFSAHVPENLLASSMILRIHLDNAMMHQGALKVISNSHQLGICPFDELENVEGNEVICQMKKGDALMLRPLLFHKTLPAAKNESRRVLQLLFSSAQLPAGLEWSECYEL